MDILKRIKNAVQNENYLLTSHANDEMADDFLEAADIENIIRTGKIIRKFTHDPRGTRYEIKGNTIGNSQGYVICRFLLSGKLLVITAYLEKQ